MKLIFVDKNQSLVDKVKELWICECYCDNIFNYEWLIVSASNPRFTFGGWLDKLIAQKYIMECGAKAWKGGGNERIGGIIFTITVNDNIEATPLLVEQAIQFAIDNTNDGETLLLSGLWTWIWRLPEETFVNILSIMELPQWNDQSM